MIDEADRDGDGEIGEEEFMRIMKKTNLFWAKVKSLAKCLEPIQSHVLLKIL